MAQLEEKVLPTRQQYHKSLEERLAAMMAKKKEALALKKQQPKQAEDQKQVQKAQIVENKQQKMEEESQQKEKRQETIEKHKHEPKKIKKIKKPEKQEKVTLRKAAGYVWEDKTMQQWNPNDYRLFCGNLGNQVTDQILSTAFRKYASFQKAKVIRDKRTSKTRGYGFVSFSNPKDYLACLEQMQNKHIGNRPVRLLKSSWKDRCIQSQKNQILPSDFRTNSKKKTNSINSNFMFTGKL